MAATTIAVLVLRSREFPPKGGTLRLLATCLWTCGAVGAPWFILANAAWGPLYEAHPLVAHHGFTLWVSQFASWWWCLSVISLVAAGIVVRLIYVRTVRGEIPPSGSMDWPRDG